MYTSKEVIPIIIPNVYCMVLNVNLMCIYIFTLNYVQTCMVNNGLINDLIQNNENVISAIYHRS